jgi:hypothetical protein
MKRGQLGFAADDLRFLAAQDAFPALTSSNRYAGPRSDFPFNSSGSTTTSPVLTRTGTWPRVTTPIERLAEARRAL